MSGSEDVLGEIPVLSRLELSSERLRIFVTSSRLIVAHVGKRGTGSGALGGSMLFGGLGSGVDSVLRGGKEAISLRHLDSMGPEKILAHDKENFAIPYGEVVQLEVIEDPHFTGLILVTVDDKFEFFADKKIDQVLELLQPKLSSKIKIIRTGASIPSDKKHGRGR